MTFDDRMNALPDDEEISRKYPRQDAPGHRYPFRLLEVSHYTVASRPLGRRGPVRNSGRKADSANENLVAGA
jgi:hypothetical protein